MWEIIDLDEELLNLLKKEEMFAFFDFNLNLPEGGTASGLCKVSRPKSADSGTYYISLLFLIDADEPAMSRAIDERINKIKWEDLSRSVHEIKSILPMPYLSVRAGIYAREIDIYLTVNELTRAFVTGFHPLLAQSMGLNAEAPVFWDDMPRGEKLGG